MKEIGIDYYVNDAFSVLHRDHMSITALPKVFPHAIGPNLEEELRNLKKLKSKLKNCLFILGGAKIKDVIPLLKNKKILSGGKLCLIILKLNNIPITKENGLDKEEMNLLTQVKKYKKKIIAPVDLAVLMNGKRKEFSIKEFPRKGFVYDIGKETIELYKKEISKAKTIFFKGSPGYFEIKGFEQGTKEILKAIANSKSFSVIAGGQSSDAIKKFNIPKNKFSYISLSGGATIKYLAGEKLPGLEALK